ncbi:Rec8 like protein-domain-containing protein [Scenedesmus sp. NREL 46B-D3]|nr:Rec8 like protein-domain-containing protein [Scenedesmus sp. NREL 46B-D3]
MFYSHDLLGRKTPLGAIWKLAHGSKLSKGKIISINLREICQEILQPGVPHSLRLDAILIGGLVIVFNKQQAYLLGKLLVPSIGEQANMTWHLMPAQQYMSMPSLLCSTSNNKAWQC